MLKCRHCSEELPEGVEICPTCGRGRQRKRNAATAMLTSRRILKSARCAVKNPVLNLLQTFLVDSGVS